MSKFISKNNFFKFSIGLVTANHLIFKGLWKDSENMKIILMQSREMEKIMDSWVNLKKQWNQNALVDR